MRNCMDKEDGFNMKQCKFEIVKIDLVNKRKKKVLIVQEPVNNFQN